MSAFSSLFLFVSMECIAFVTGNYLLSTGVGKHRRQFNVAILIVIKVIAFIMSLL